MVRGVSLRHVSRCSIAINGAFPKLSSSGGGSTVNTDLNRFGPALRWMTYEAGSYGLRLKAYKGEWKDLSPTDSMTFWWMVLEMLPLKRLSYMDVVETTSE